jgi:hypothetical protein
MPRLVIVSWSQTGQLDQIVRALTAPLEADPAWQVTRISLVPVNPYPFPWPFLRFFDTFPETVAGIAPPIAAPALPEGPEPDLVILAYQVWFLSPAGPMTAFLDRPEASRLLAGRRVMTLVACRNMWIEAQRVMVARLASLGARHLDHIAITDTAHPAATFISTPWWMLTGQRGPLLGGLIPRAGVPNQDIAGAARFGQAICDELPLREPNDDRPLLSGLGAVSVRPGLIAAERIGRRSFMLWGNFLRHLGCPGTPLRRIALIGYVIFLVTMILTVAPLSALIRAVLAPFRRASQALECAQIATPSGEGRERLVPL